MCVNNVCADANSCWQETLVWQVWLFLSQDFKDRRSQAQLSWISATTQWRKESPGIVFDDIFVSKCITMCKTVGVLIFTVDEFE